MRQGFLRIVGEGVLAPAELDSSLTQEAVSSLTLTPLFTVVPNSPKNLKKGIILTIIMIILSFKWIYDI